VAARCILTELNRHFERPIICRCAFCSLKVKAPLEETRQAFERHECNRPRPTSTVRRRSGFALRATRATGS
jgi:hypothetical protein